MLKVTATTKIFLAVKPADFRKGIDGLAHYCRVLSTALVDPKSGAYIVFVNRARTMLRVLHHDGTGYWLATKRLSRGRFSSWPKSLDEISSYSAEELMALLK